jgi:hypothetical protein
MPLAGELAAMSCRVAWNCRGSTGSPGASRCCGGWIGRGDRSAAAANSNAYINYYTVQPCYRLTIETTRCPHNGLDDAHDTLEPLLDVCILCLHRLFLAEHHLQVMVRLLVLEVADALIQAVNLVLCALANGALGLAVVCALPGQLFGGEVGDAARVGARPALLVGQAIFGLLTVSDGRGGCVGLGWGRHADYGRLLDAIQLRERELHARVMKLARHGV